MVVLSVAAEISKADFACSALWNILIDGRDTRRMVIESLMYHSKGYQLISFFALCTTFCTLTIHYSATMLNILHATSVVFYRFLSALHAN